MQDKERALKILKFIFIEDERGVIKLPKIPGVRKRSENTYQFTVSTGKASSKDYGRKYKTYTVEQKLTPKQLVEHLKHEYLEI